MLATRWLFVIFFQNSSPTIEAQISSLVDVVPHHCTFPRPNMTPLTWYIHQYIKILTCVCVTEVGCSWGGTRLVTRDLRTSIYCSLIPRPTRGTGYEARFTEPRTPRARRMFENIGRPGMVWNTSKRTQSGEQPLKRHRELSGARLLTVGERGGSS